MNELDKIAFKRKFRRGSNKIVETILAWIKKLEAELERIDAEQDAIDAATQLAVDKIKETEANNLAVIQAKREELARQENAVTVKRGADLMAVSKKAEAMKQDTTTQRALVGNVLAKVKTITGDEA